MKKFFSHITIRKGFILGVTLLVLSNFFFLIGYYGLFLSKSIDNNYLEIESSLNKHLDTIIPILEENTSDWDKIIKEYINNNPDLIINLKHNNQIISSYNSSSKIKLKNCITSSNIVKKDNDSYLISISKERNGFVFRLSIDFLIFEIIMVLTLTLTGLFGANVKLLGPLTFLSQDMINYKCGIKPKKRPIKSSVDKIQNEFVELVEELEKEEQKQNRIIASISHDIKTPLTSILGYSERLIKNPNIPQETHLKYETTIYNKALTLKEIIDEFDDYLGLHLEDTKKYTTVQIKELISYLNNYYKDDLEEKNITLNIKSNCANSFIYVDMSKFKRIFSNTITNSIRHLKKNKNLINITINHKNHDKIIFEIADNGLGTKEDLEKIFEPLYTTDPSRKISGLGLAICKEIIESLNGEIYAENNNLGGFSIIFIIDEYKETKL